MQPFYLAYQGCNDKELQKIYGELVHRIIASRYPKYAECRTMPPCESGGLLRIGMISGYFHAHSVWKLFKGWVENLDKRRLIVFGYYTGTIKDNETKIARQNFARFVEDIYSFEELCEIIRRDNLHVLIYPEIGMDPITLKLAALKLAPIQCASWGHPETSGLPTIDYFLSSDLMEPSDADDHYNERLIRLPNLSVYYTPLGATLEPIDHEKFSINPKAVLYLCCQSLFKYLPQYDEVFPRIAQEADNCQFLFISHKSVNVTEQFRLRINQSFEKYSLKGNDYIVFLPPLNPGQYNAINSLSDIYLDSIGWSGGNTTLEAIACDLPVVTTPGKFMRGRHSSAILTMMGVTETIALNIDEYVNIAIRLSNDADWRCLISEKVADRKHLAYRDRTCIKALEEFIKKVVQERSG